ncbi:MAG: hypothetical protein ACJ8BW_31175 [Ktedonobacteraceae bacterium]
MAVGDDEIESSSLRHSQVLEHTHPAVFVLLSTSALRGGLPIDY